MIDARSLARARALAFLTVLAGAAACGSDGGNGDQNPPPPPPSNGTVVVAATDFVTGRLATVSLDAPYAVTQNVAEISSDPVVRVESDGLVYVVNRFGFDNVQVIDPEAGFATTTQFSTENGSNPQDVAIRDGVAFVSRYEAAQSDVAVFDVASGDLLGRIDLLPYADVATDPSVLPRPNRIVADGGLLWVVLNQIDPTFSIFGRGALVAVDPATRAVVDSIGFAGQNPLAADFQGGNVYVASNGVFSPQALTGGVEIADVATGTARILVDDDALGGNVSDVEIVSATIGYAVVANQTAFVNDVVQFDPTTGAIGPTVFTCEAFLPEIAWNGGDELVVACQESETPGVSILDATTGALLAGPLDVGLPPASLAFLD